jgi:uncharacterized membrane protein YdbT with pleckstrin-like domain
MAVCNREKEVTMDREVKINRSAVPLTLQVVAAIVLIKLFASVITTALLVFTNRVMTGWIVLGLGFLSLVEIIMLGVVLVNMTIHWLGRKYELRGRHLAVTEQFITVNEKMYELTNLRSVDLKQSWFGRYFKYGDIELAFAMPGEPLTVTLYDVHLPQKTESIFEAILDENSRAPQPYYQEEVAMPRPAYRGTPASQAH